MKMDEKEIAAELAEKYCVKAEMNKEFLKEYSEKHRSGELVIGCPVDPIDPESILTKMEKLKKIALELLSKYKKSEENVIWECSCDIQEDTDNLVAEVGKYRERIEELTR